MLTIEISAIRTAVLFAILAASGLALRIKKSTLSLGVTDPKVKVDILRAYMDIGGPRSYFPDPIYYAGMTDPKGKVDMLRAYMEDSRTDLQAQVNGCIRLQNFSMEDREGPGPFGGNKVADKWLIAGLYDGLAQGMLNILALPESAASEEEIYQAAATCFRAIEFSVVQNDERKAVLKYYNSPHVFDAMVGFYERFRARVIVPGSEFPMCVFAGLYGSWNNNPGAMDRDALSEISRGLDRAGGFKFILDVLENNYTNPELFQAATCALSDHLVGSKAAPKIIADNNDGIRILTNGVRHAQGAPPFHEGNGFGLRYEILEDVTGLLKYDNGTYARAFLEEGLMEDTLKLMPEEPNDLYFQDHCCQVFNWLTNSNPSAQHKLAQTAAVQLVQKVVTEPCAGTCSYPTPIVRALNLTGSPPPPSCVSLHKNLQQFFQGRAQWQDYPVTPPFF